MFFYYPNILFPSFTQKPYIKTIEQKLRDKHILNGDIDSYKALIQLKNHASKIAASLHELKSIYNAQGSKSNTSLITELDLLISQVLIEATKPHYNPSKYKNVLTNTFALLESKIDEDYLFNKFSSGASLFGHVIGSSACAATAVIILASDVAITASFGMALLSVGLACVSILMAGLLAYNALVQGRNLFDFQLKEIHEGIDFLTSREVKAPEVKCELSFLRM